MEYQFRNSVLDFNGKNIFIMGILNVTPDSFSDGGKYFDRDKALSHALGMLEEGADIIDVGGESTRPFSDPVSEQEEMDRVIPVIESIYKKSGALISVDTCKHRVAEEALKAGAQIINDISGMTFDREMEEVALRYKAVCVIMHIQGTPENMQSEPVYQDVVSEVYEFLSGRADALVSHGLQVIVDPGFGFGKTLEHNYILLKNLRRFLGIGCPILAGISRKSMIGNVTGTQPENRLGGSVALNTAAVLNGASIIRVHDVAEHFQMKKVLERLLVCGILG